MKEDSRYTFAVGKIRALEAKLFGRDIISRLISSDTEEETSRILSETDYKNLKSKNFDEFFRKNLKDTIKMLKNLSLNEPITRILSLRYDFNNARVALKNALAKDGGTKGLPRGFADTAKTAEAVFSKNKSWREIDIIFEKEWLRHMYSEVEKLGNDFLRNLLIRFADITNIKTFFRLRAISAEKSLLSNTLLNYGSIQKTLFVEGWEEPQEVFPKKISHTPYSEFVKEGEVFSRENNSLARLERLSSEHILEFLKKCRYVVSGYEPIVAYLIFKENELRSLKIILIGKQAGINNDLIKEMVPIL